MISSRLNLAELKHVTLSIGELELIRYILAKEIQHVEDWVKQNPKDEDGRIEKETYIARINILSEKIVAELTK